MTRRATWLTRRGMMAGMISAAGSGALAEAPGRSVRPTPRPSGKSLVETVVAAPKVSASEALIKAANLSGDVGFALADTMTGEVLEARLGKRPLPPASTLKVVTALYALDRLGPGHQFETRILATGPVTNGRLDGDLVLAGGGDPTLDTDRLAALAQALREAGITEVTGRFLIWPGALPRGKRIDEDQPEHVAYNPSFGGLNLNFNRVHFKWETEGRERVIKMQARSRNFSPATSIAQMALIDRKSPIFEYRDWGRRDQWSVAEWALGKKDGARWLPVRYPALYCGDVFRTLARSNGIVLKPGELVATLPQATELVSLTSDTLVPMLEGMLKYSTNLTAEAVGMAASLAKRDVNGLVTSGGEMSSWSMAKFGAVGVRFKDHSGLGYASSITPEDMVSILSANTEISPLLKPVNLSYDKSITQPKTIEARAKTGTLNFVSSLAGFVGRQNGRNLAFTIFTADTARRDAIPPAERENPPGARSWARRSRRLQKQLILDWAQRLV